MMRRICKYIFFPIIVFVIDWLAIFCSMMIFNYMGLPHDIMCYLSSAILVVLDYILLSIFYKDDKLIYKVLGIICIFPIILLTNLVADSIIHSDDVFAILEGSFIIANALIVLLVLVVATWFRQKMKEE